LKKVLIISPFFPPVNAADMHRVRQSVSYYKENGWDAEVVVVDAAYVNMVKDDLLLDSIPANINIHKVKAFDEKVTRKFGLGSIAYRSMYYYWKFVNQLLSKTKYDLVFFSTTAYPITILGRIWKWKFNIPYIIDMQDPWRSDHYLSLPINQRPPKFWLSYRLDSFFEKFAMHKVDGLMSVSQSYIDVLISRYKNLLNIPTKVVPFAAFPIDIEISKNSSSKNIFFDKNDESFNIVYVGRGGTDMELANTIFLKAIRKGIDLYPELSNIRLYYIGTSYDASGNGSKTILPIAQKLGLENILFEHTSRIPYFESLKVLSEASILFVPGSDNIGYTASKIYPYVWMNKPMITLFHSSSNVNTFMKECNAGISLQFDTMNEDDIIDKLVDYIIQHKSGERGSEINWIAFEKYTSEFQVKSQVELFNDVVSNVS